MEADGSIDHYLCWTLNLLQNFRKVRIRMCPVICPMSVYNARQKPDKIYFPPGGQSESPRATKKRPLDKQHITGHIF